MHRARSQADLLRFHSHVDVLEVAQAHRKVYQIQILDNVQGLPPDFLLVFSQPNLGAVLVHLHPALLSRSGGNEPLCAPSASISSQRHR